jgi:hypothetical protein
MKVGTAIASFIVLAGYLLMGIAPLISPILYYKFYGLLVYFISFGMMGFGTLFLAFSLGKDYMRAFLFVGIPMALLNTLFNFWVLQSEDVFSSLNYSGVHETAWGSIIFYFYTSTLYGIMIYGVLTLIGYRLFKWVKNARL